MRTPSSSPSSLVAALVAVAGVLAVAPDARAEFSSSAAAALRYRDVCPSTGGLGRHCDAKVVVDDFGQMLTTAAPAGLTPADLQAAYGLSATGGSGRLVALYGGDSDYTNAESDLAVYRQQFGLPACTTANGCFHKVDQNGGKSYPAAGTDNVEQALDMEMASAACPGCQIMIVEGGDLGAALKTVRAAGAVGFSFSIEFGYGAQTGQQCQSLGYNADTGLVIGAATGDSAYPGARDFLPVACQGVVAVGGTTLKKANNTRGFTETTWNGTGSGCSPYVAKPAWQTDTGCSMRMESDLAALADPATGAAVYATQGANGWLVVGGTSAATPITVAALANLGVANGHFSPAWIWKNTANFFDVTSGNNGTCSGSPSYYCTSGTGYDGPTGWGAVDGKTIATFLANAAATADAGTGGVDAGAPSVGDVGATTDDGGTTTAGSASSTPLSSGVDGGSGAATSSAAHRSSTSLDFEPAGGCAVVVENDGRAAGPWAVGALVAVVVGVRRRRRLVDR